MMCINFSSHKRNYIKVWNYFACYHWLTLGILTEQYAPEVDMYPETRGAFFISLPK
jgi:hypothetical protein